MRFTFKTDGWKICPNQIVLIAQVGNVNTQLIESSGGWGIRRIVPPPASAETGPSDDSDMSLRVNPSSINRKPTKNSVSIVGLFFPGAVISRRRGTFPFSETLVSEFIGNLISPDHYKFINTRYVYVIIIVEHYIQISNRLFFTLQWLSYHYLRQTICII